MFDGSCDLGGWVSRKIGFRYFAFRVGDEAMNDRPLHDQRKRTKKKVLIETKALLWLWLSYSHIF